MKNKSSGCSAVVIHKDQELDSFINDIRSSIPTEFGLSDVRGRFSQSSDTPKYVSGIRGSELLDRENTILVNLSKSFETLNSKLNDELTAISTLKNNYQDVDKYLNTLVLELGLDPIPGKLSSVTLKDSSILDYTQSSDRYIDIGEQIIDISSLDPGTRNMLISYGLLDEKGNSDFLSSLQLPYDRRTNTYAIPNMVLKEENGKYTLIIQLDVTDHNGNTVELDDKTISKNVKDTLVNIYSQQGSSSFGFIGGGLGSLYGAASINLSPKVVGTDTKYLCLDLTGVVEKAKSYDLNVDKIFGGSNI